MNRALALAVAAFTLAGPAHAVTFPPEIILTDGGFRRIEDCTQVMRRNVWRDGHYWSVRPGWDCTAGDDPYGGGKGDWFATDEDLLFLPYRVTTVAPGPIAQAIARGGAVRSGSVSGLSWVGYGSGSGSERDDETTTTVEMPSPVPLPPALMGLALALAALGSLKRKQAG